MNNQIQIYSRVDQANTNPIQSLIRRVGAANYFQYRMYAVFALKWFMAGLFLMSLNFLFLTANFICEEGQSGSEDCKKWVCSHTNENFWREHLLFIPKSLSFEFGLYICTKEWVVSLTQSMLYLGSFTGYIILSYFADNFGRKQMHLVSWLIAIAGIITLTCSFSIQHVGVGLFLCGMGINTSITLQFTFIKEFVYGNAKQIMMITSQLIFSLGLCVIAFITIYVKNWRLLCIFCFAIPIIMLLLGHLYIEETPQFSLSKSYEVLRKSLNRIAAINGYQPLSMEQVKEQLKYYKRDTSSKLSILSLFKYKSLRLTTYCFAFIPVALVLAYDGTLLNFNRIGLNVHTNQMVIGVAEICGALFTNFIVPILKRKFYTISVLVTIGLLLLLIVFVGINQSDSDSRAFIELGILIIMRFVLSGMWGFYYIYLTELYPSEITTIAAGYMIAVSALAGATTPYMKLASKNGSMIVMAFMAFVAAGHVCCLRQTKGLPMQLRIEERDNIVVAEQGKKSQVLDTKQEAVQHTS